jgi:hypothetical protein
MVTILFHRYYAYEKVKRCRHSVCLNCVQCLALWVHENLSWCLHEINSEILKYIFQNYHRISAYRDIHRLPNK